MSERVIQTGMAGGEIAPSLYGHVDLDKYKSGSAFARNFFVDFRGGLSNRAGTEFIGACKVSDTITWETEVRLIPFIYSSDTSYVCEFGHDYVRFISNGEYIESSPGVVYEIASPYTAAQLAALKFDQAANTLILVHAAHTPYQLIRTSSTTFTLTAMTFAPTIGRPPGVLITQVNEVDIKSAFSYTVTAVDANNQESEQSIWAYQVGSILNQVTWIANKIKWTAVAGATRYRVFKSGPWPSVINTHSTPPSTTYGFIGEAQSNFFVDNNIAPDYSQTPPQLVDPVAPGQISQVTVASAGSDYTYPTYLWYANLIFTGGGGSGAEGIALIDSETHTVVGTYIFRYGNGYTSAPVVTDDAANTATYTATIGPVTGTYPSVVSFGQQRLWFGATDNLPQGFTASQTGTYTNFDTHPLLLESDAITANLAGRQVNAIKSLFTMSTGMVALTTGGAYLITGGGQGTAITPGDITALPQASSGANDLPPLIVPGNASSTNIGGFLYGQNKGNVVRDCTFSFYTQNYTGADRSVLASHLFINHSLLEWCYAEEPFRQVLAVRDDGRILALTYVPEQEIYAWTHYDTQGQFLSITSVPEGDTNAVYVVVRRHISGDPCWVNYVERFDPRQFDCLLEAWFLDCALQFPLSEIDSDIFLSGNSGAVTISAFDPCEEQPEGDGPFAAGTYSLTPYQPFGGTVQAMIESSDPALFTAQSAQQYMGQSYDPVSGQLFFSSCVLIDSTASGSGFDKINDTGHILYDIEADAAVAPLAHYDGSYLKNFYLNRLNVSTGAVTMNDVFDPTAVIPNGIHGSDGTWRMAVACDISLPNHPPQFKLVDPRTTDCFVHMVAPECNIYVFRRGEDYLQQLLPFGTSGGHMEMLGITANWLLIMASTHPDRDDGQLYTIPRLTTAEETANGQLLGYFVETQPGWMDAAYWRTVLAPDGTLYVFGNARLGTRDYRLYQYVPPATVGAWMGSAQPGGTFTDITPWSSSTGPNTDCAAWVYNTVVGQNLHRILQWKQNSPFSLPGTGQLAFLSTLCPPAADAAGLSHSPTNFRVDCTYYDIAGVTFDYQQGFVGGLMTAAWEVTAVAADAAFVPQFIRETDCFREMNAYDYGDDYTVRWLEFSCQPVVGGTFTWGSGPNHNLAVFVKYKFTYGSAPEVLDVKVDSSWLPFYAAYATALGNNNVVEQSILMDGSTSNLEFVPGETYLADSGFVTGTGLWFGGWNGGGTHLESILINPAFPQYRGTWTDFDPYPLPAAVVRVSWGASAGDIIQHGCGKIQVTSVPSSWVLNGVVISPLEGIEVPDDPTGLIFPILSGDWTITTPVSSISGLGHLEGKVVYALVDGVVQGPFTVLGGSITLVSPGTNIIVGLLYTSQFQALPLDAGLPTTQAKRKTLPAINVKVDKTQGISAGPDFNNLTPMKECSGGMTSATIRTCINAQWTRYGQVVIEQDQPLPVSILALIPEFTVGDTAQ